jgi:hypothetical protein
MKSISSLLTLSLPLLCFQAGLTQGDTFIDALYGEAKCKTVPMMMGMSVVQNEKCIPSTCGVVPGGSMARSCVKDEKTGLSTINKLYGKKPYIRIDSYDNGCKQRYTETTFILADGSCIPFGSRESGSYKLDSNTKTLTAKMYNVPACAGTPMDTKVIKQSDFGQTCIFDSKIYGSIASNITTEGPKAIQRQQDNDIEPLVAKVYYSNTKCTSSNGPDSIWFDAVEQDICQSTTSTCSTARKNVGSKPTCLNGVGMAIEFTNSEFAKSKKDFAVVQFYSSKSKCTGDSQTAVLRADNSCIIGKDAAKSYKLSFDKKDQSITFTSYKDAACKTKENSFKASKDQQVSNACLNDAYTVTYGPLYAQMVSQPPPSQAAIQGVAFFKGDTCGKQPPDSMMFQITEQCQNLDCTGTSLKGYTQGAKCFKSEDEIAFDVINMFGKIPFVKTEIYSEDGCKGEKSVYVHKADGNCVVSPDLKTSSKVKVEKDGSVSYTNYSVATCDSKKIIKKGKVSKNDMEKQICQEKRWILQSSAQINMK